MYLSVGAGDELADGVEDEADQHLRGVGGQEGLDRADDVGARGTLGDDE